MRLQGGMTSLAPTPGSKPTAGPPGANSPAATASSHGRWGILLTLFLARIAMGFQFLSIAAVSRPLQDEFDLTHAAIGTLVGMYLLPGIILAIPGGVLGGKLGDKRSILLGIGLMMAGGFLGGIADDYTMVVIGRLLAGTGVIFLFIMIPKTVSEWFTGRQLFFAMSLYLGGWPVGIALALVVHPFMVDIWHWSSVFLSTGILCALIFPVCLLVLRDPPNAIHIEAPSVGRAFRMPWLEIALATLAGLLWTVLNSAHTIILAFGPRFIETLGHSAAEAGAYVSINIWVGIATLPLGGWFASRFGRPNAFIVASALIGGTAIMMIAILPDLFILWFVMMGAFFFLSAGVIVALPMEVLSPRNKAAGLGVFYTWWYIGMAGLPAVGGWTRDITGDAGAPIIFAGSLGLSAIILLALFRLLQRRVTPA